MGWIELDGAGNVRDLGGLPGRDGQRTAARRLLRGDNLQELSPADVSLLVALSEPGGTTPNSAIYFYTVIARLKANVTSNRAQAALAAIDRPVDMVEVFRNSAALPGIAREAIDIGAKVLWAQLGVRNDEAARLAEAAGLKVVMNRCPKIEYSRLHGELSWSGANSRIISSKRR